MNKKHLVPSQGAVMLEMSLSLTHSEAPGEQSPSTEINKQDREQPFATASFRRSWSLNVICPCCVLLCNALLFSPHSETFSFVLTGEDGSRRFGYCRRLLVSTLASQSSKALRRASAGFLWFPVHHERRDRKCGGLTGSLKTWRKVSVSCASREQCLHILWEENTFSRPTSS